MRLLLVVKGDREAALKAAQLHGVGAVWNGHVLNTCRDYSLLTAAELDHLRAVCWFLADSDRPPPYLVGSLLHYSLVE